MARLDVYQLPGRTKHGHVVDVQADLLSHLSTRVVVPLLPISEFRHVAAELNPVIPIDGQDHILVPQAIATVPRRELKTCVGTLSTHHDVILRAIDVLLSGV